MAAGYTYTEYAVPGLTWTVTPTIFGYVYGSYTNLAVPITNGTGTWFTAAMIDQDSSHYYDPGPAGGSWDHTLGIQFVNADATRSFYLTLSQMISGEFYAFTNPRVFSFNGTMTRIRPWVVSNSHWGPPPGTATLNVAGGKIRIYQYTTQGGSADVVCAKTDEQRVLVNGGKDGEDITRIRYRGVQTLPGSINWSVTPTGNIVEKYT